MRHLPWAARVAALLLFASSALAFCLPRERMEARLAERHQERRTAGGVAGGNLVELYMTVDGSTWTIVVTNPNRISCLLADGEGWRWRGPKKPQGPRT